MIASRPSPRLLFDPTVIEGGLFIYNLKQAFACFNNSTFYFLLSIFYFLDSTFVRRGSCQIPR